MKRMDRVKVWNHTLSGKLIGEGIGTLRRKDTDFKYVNAPEYFGNRDGSGYKRRGKFERWIVTFDDYPKETYSRWVREEDLIDPFAKANKRLKKLAKELSKDPELRKIL